MCAITIAGFKSILKCGTQQLGQAQPSSSGSLGRPRRVLLSWTAARVERPSPRGSWDVTGAF